MSTGPPAARSSGRRSPSLDAWASQLHVVARRPRRLCTRSRVCWTGPLRRPRRRFRWTDTWPAIADRLIRPALDADSGLPIERGPIGLLKATRERGIVVANRGGAGAGAAGRALSRHRSDASRARSIAWTRPSTSFAGARKPMPPLLDEERDVGVRGSHEQQFRRPARRGWSSERQPRCRRFARSARAPRSRSTSARRSRYNARGSDSRKVIAAAAAEDLACARSSSSSRPDPTISRVAAGHRRRKPVDATDSDGDPLLGANRQATRRRGPGAPGGSRRGERQVLRARLRLARLERARPETQGRRPYATHVGALDKDGGHLGCERMERTAPEARRRAVAPARRSRRCSRRAAHPPTVRDNRSSGSEHGSWPAGE